MLARQIEEEFLILVKTYPQPSRSDRETTCVAAVNREGQMRRVFPVPFRLLQGEAQFKKWEWVRARISKAANDHRPESFKIDCDSIQRLQRIGTQNSWRERRQWVAPHIVESFEALENRRVLTGETLGIVRVARVLGLDITPEKNADWTPQESEKLSRECLFDSDEIRTRQPLRKMPIGVHYRYVDERGAEHKHRVTDWEIGALYWNCLRTNGPNWEKPFRQMLEENLPSKDLMFLMGTIHRFPDQWLIVGLIYPSQLKPALQAELKFE